MASICGATESNFVERIATIIPPGLKDAWNLAERTSGLPSHQGNQCEEQVTVPGVSYGEVGSGEETLKYTFTLHCASLFRRIRGRYGIKDDDFRSSLCSHRAIKGGVVTAETNGGESGAAFFFSKDHKFVFKVLRQKEADLLRSLLPSYLDYLDDDNSYTLLPRYFALVSVQVEGKSPLILQVTNNVFYVNRPIALKYDLKGASVGRYVDEADLLIEGHPKVLKERNFSSRGLLRESRDDEFDEAVANKLSVGPDMKENLLHQLKRDTTWLEEHNLIDYSLLVGVVNNKAGPDSASQFEDNKAQIHLNKIVLAQSSGKGCEDRRSSWSMAAVHENSDMASDIYDQGHWHQSGIDPIALQGGSETYVLGLVDILQEYNCPKATEHGIKELIACARGGHPHCMSVIPASPYAARLLHYIAQNLE
jgi:hypothetical protein